MKNKPKEKREYYILAGEVGLKEKLFEEELKLSPPFLLIVKEHSKIGKLISKEAKRKCRSSNTGEKDE